MVLGMSLATFTIVHVILSLIGIVSGLVVFAGLLGSKRLPGWTALFLVTTILTSLTGFLFPFTKFGPPHAFGVISLVVLAIAMVGLYSRGLRGAWRGLYVVGALIALYLNVVVLIVQTFQKVAPFRALAPTQSELPFVATQLIALGLVIVVGIRALARFRPVEA